MLFVWFFLCFCFSLPAVMVNKVVYIKHATVSVPHRSTVPSTTTGIKAKFHYVSGSQKGPRLVADLPARASSLLAS